MKKGIKKIYHLKICLYWQSPFFNLQDLLGIGNRPHSFSKSGTGLWSAIVFNLQIISHYGQAPHLQSFNNVTTLQMKQVGVEGQHTFAKNSQDFVWFLSCPRLYKLLDLEQELPVPQLIFVRGLPWTCVQLRIFQFGFVGDMTCFETLTQWFEGIILFGFGDLFKTMTESKLILVNKAGLFENHH